jgi:SnoaL-like domain
VDRVTEMSIKMACADIVARYAMAVNQWDLNAFVGLFTEDATWQRPRSAPLEGHAEIRAFMDARPRDLVLRHVNGASWAEVIDEHHANGWSQTTVFETSGTTEIPAPLELPSMIVEYRDQYREVDGGWFISRRDTTWVFLAEPFPPSIR